MWDLNRKRIFQLKAFISLLSLSGCAYVDFFRNNWPAPDDLCADAGDGSHADAEGFCSLTGTPANLDTDSTDDFSGAYADLTGKPANIDEDSTDDVVTGDIGVTVQAYDADLDDLADGTLSKSKVEDSGNWDTAFGWGDHSAAGYIGATAASNAFVDAAGDTMTGNLDLGGNTVSNGVFAGDGAGLTNLPWDSLTGTPANLDTDSTDDFSGAYADLTGKPANIDEDNTDDVVTGNIGVTVQAYDADLDDLSDGTLSLGKVEVLMGEIYIPQSNAVATLITTASTWYAISGVAVAGNVSISTEVGGAITNMLKCTNSTVVPGRMSAVISFTCEAKNQLLEFAAYRNSIGNIIASSIIEKEVKDVNTSDSFAFQWMASNVGTNDQFGIAVRNLTAAKNCTIKTLNLSVLGL